jgi:hypothetical protein
MYSSIPKNASAAAVTMNEDCNLAAPRGRLMQQLRAAARSHIHGANEAPAGWTAVYTLADPRDLRRARYVGQTRQPRRRFTQHLHTARLWLPDATPWWVGSPQHRPLYTWIRALHRDGGRLPFMWIVEWLEPGRDRLAAERAAIMTLLAQCAELLNAEARALGAQLPLL